MHRSRALIIFAKKPVPGRVKTRLSPPLTAEDAAELYSCMLRDTLRRAKLLGEITAVIFFQQDPGAREYFQEIAPEFESLPQPGGNLGERMKNAFDLMFARGYEGVAIIGSDSPDLPAEYISDAFSIMEHESTDGVFGPAEDGGYYLLAMKRVWTELFDNIPWSSGEVLLVSRERAASASIKMALLPQWNDVDNFSDLFRPALGDKRSSAHLTREFINSKVLLPSKVR